MKKRILTLLFIGLTISCSNDNSNKPFEINGRFTHQIKDCDNSGNPEFNCISFIEFVDDSTIDFLIGGDDIISRTSYRLNDNIIQLEETGTLKISFEIQNETALKRKEDGEIWKKAQ